MLGINENGIYDIDSMFRKMYAPFGFVIIL